MLRAARLRSYFVRNRRMECICVQPRAQLSGLRTGRRAAEQQEAFGVSDRTRIQPREGKIYQALTAFHGEQNDNQTVFCPRNRP